MAFPTLFTLMSFASLVQAPYELSGYTITTPSPPPSLSLPPVSSPPTSRWFNDTNGVPLYDTAYQANYEPLVWQCLLVTMASMLTFSCLFETYMWFRSFSFRNPWRNRKMKDDLEPRKIVHLPFNGHASIGPSRCKSKPKETHKRRASHLPRSRDLPKLKRRCLTESCAKDHPFKGMHVRFGPYDLIYGPSMRAEIISDSFHTDCGHNPLVTIDHTHQVPSPSPRGPTMILSSPKTCLDLRCSLQNVNQLTHAIVGNPTRARFRSIYFPYHQPEDFDKLVLFHWPSPSALINQRRLLHSRFARSATGSSNSPTEKSTRFFETSSGNPDRFVPEQADLVDQKNRLKDTPVPELTWNPFKDRLWYVPAKAIALREHLAKVLMERSLWPSHIRFTLDPDAPYDLGFFPGLNLLSTMVGGKTLDKISYQAAGREVVTVTRPHGFPTLMVYFYP